MHLVGGVLVCVRGLQSADARLAIREPDRRPADAVRGLRGVVCDDHAGVIPHLQPVPKLHRLCGRRVTPLPRARMPHIRWGGAALNASVLVGALFCVLPPFAPAEWRGQLWALVWMGPFFLLEPFNYRRGMPSIFRDWERGDLSRTLQLFTAGALCGLLWEFWNMWAFKKWVYIFPAGQAPKYFEMPLAGFLGFLPFALDYFAMFHFIASFFTREDRLGI